MSHYYGKPLRVAVTNGLLRVEIGVDTLAHAVSYADWANPFDESANDYIRTFAIADAKQFAKDVMMAMQQEREDGSSPLTDFLDSVSQAAVDDGSEACYEARIKHGTTHESEAWANRGVVPSTQEK